MRFCACVCIRGGRARGCTGGIQGVHRGRTGGAQEGKYFPIFCTENRSAPLTLEQKRVIFISHTSEKASVVGAPCWGAFPHTVIPPGWRGRELRSLFLQPLVPLHSINI